MEALAKEIAKVLGITVEKAIELYPVLKKQFVVYKILNSITNTLSVVIIVLSILLGVSAFLWLSNLDYATVESTSSYTSMYHKHYLVGKKSYKVILICLAIVIILNTALIAILFWTTPDFMLIKEFILK